MIQQVLMGRQRTCKKLWNRRIWWRWILQLLPAGMWHPLVWWKCTDVSSSHHRRPWCLLHRLTMEAGGSLWNSNTLLPDYTFHFKRQRYEYFKILTGVQNTSEDAKMSVGIRLIPDLEWHHHARLSVTAAAIVCLSSSDNTSCSWTPAKATRGRGLWSKATSVLFMSGGSAHLS